MENMENNKKINEIIIKKIKKMGETIIEIIRNLTPNWFSTTMATGVISVLLETLPFQFRGLHTISIIIFIINIIIFCILTLLTIARYIIFPSLFNITLKHPQQSMFIGAIPIGISTIVNYCALVIIKQYGWGTNLTFVLWCIQLFLTIFSCFTVPYYIFIHHSHSLESINCAWILPIIPGVFTAASGGLLANNIGDTQKALVIIIISYMLMGASLALGFTITVICFYRLAIHKLPAKEVIITAFIPLGAFGQSAYGILELGSACEKVIGDTYIIGLGSTAHSMGLIISFMLWGYGLWFLIMAILFIGAYIWFKYKQLVPFNMTWWALVFPLGSFTAATIAIGNTLNSLIFHVLGSIFTVILVIIWIIVTIKTIIGIFTGVLLFPSKLLPNVIGETNRD